MIDTAPLLTPAEYIAPFVKSQINLAKRMGVSAQYVSDILNERRALNPKMADKIAKALRMSDGDRGRLHYLAAVAQGWRIDIL